MTNQEPKTVMTRADGSRVVHLSIIVPESLAAQLRAIAKEQDRSVSSIARQLFDTYIQSKDHHEPRIEA